jgi:hypothetical protein
LNRLSLKRVEKLHYSTHLAKVRRNFWHNSTISLELVIEVLSDAHVGHLGIGFGSGASRNTFTNKWQVMTGVGRIGSESTQPYLINFRFTDIPGGEICSNGVSVFTTFEPLGFVTCPNVVALAEIIDYTLGALHHVGTHSEGKVNLIIFHTHALANLVIPIENGAHK